MRYRRKRSFNRKFSRGRRSKRRSGKSLRHYNVSRGGVRL